MPRVEILTQQIANGGVTFLSGKDFDATNQHEVKNNDGRKFVIVKNTDTVSRTVTVITPATYYGHAVADDSVPCNFEQKAFHETALAGTNNDLRFTADKSGPEGNDIRIRYVVSGNNTPLTVSLSGKDITVNVATDGVGAPTSTATAVKTALDGDSGIAALIDTANAAGNDGTGVVAAFVFVNLATGHNGETMLGPWETPVYNQTDGSVYIDVPVSSSVLRLYGFRL